MRIGATAFHDAGRLVIPMSSPALWAGGGYPLILAGAPQHSSPRAVYRASDSDAAPESSWLTWHPPCFDSSKRSESALMVRPLTL
jgi:hypothetical protein